MHPEINEKIKKAQQGIARLHKIDSMVEQLKLEQENLIQKESELKVIKDKEKGEAEKLENGSIASFFYSMLGSLEEHVEKERKEALAAKLKYDQTVKDLADVKYQISTLISERVNYVDCQKEYDTFYAEKKKELMKGNGGTVEKILELTSSLNLVHINLKEIKEAILVGNKVLDSLDGALGSLDSAEAWGTFDLLGGGLISDLVKHSRIDDAKVEIENTQRLLREFKTELTDVSIRTDVIVETDGFAKFADFFFDGLIADWFMQSKINQSLESVSNVKSQVADILGRLGDMETQEVSNVERLEAEVSKLIISA